MATIKFYKDSVSSFECDVHIEGASYDNSKARLVLYFSDRNLMFESDTIGGKVSISIPPLSEIEDERGEAVLEVIADSTYFDAWKSPITLGYKKLVTIKEVVLSEDTESLNTGEKSITIENIETSDFDIDLNEAVSFVKSCSPKNYRFAKSTLSKFENLENDEKTEALTALETFKPNDSISRWADTVFANPTSVQAKYCMYKIQSNTGND